LIGFLRFDDIMTRKESMELTAMSKRNPEKPQLGREDVLKSAIAEAITILEESRKAFKSKQIEALRKRLTQVLIDAA
jgi:hypothetical protein